MTQSCSQCTFRSNFESALIMHRQLHHQTGSFNGHPEFNKDNIFTGKSDSVPRVLPLSASFPPRETKLANRTSSATRLFEKLRTRICRSRTLFAHPEEPADVGHVKELSVPSDCTSKALKSNSITSRSRCSVKTSLREIQKETYSCHLCSFDADRITVLDRHLLNYHKIGIEDLLKLVMAKTKDGLAEDLSNSVIYGIRQPYYKLSNIIEEGEFIVETMTPKIKILKHATTNTDLKWTDIPNLEVEDSRKLTDGLENLIKYPMENNENDFMKKMQTLNECMYKYVDSSNTLKKVLNKELVSKHGARENRMGDQPFFNLCLGERDTPRDWQRAQSEKMDRSRKKLLENCGEKSKISSESFYF